MYNIVLVLDTVLCIYWEITTIILVNIHYNTSYTFFSLLVRFLRFTLLATFKYTIWYCIVTMLHFIAPGLKYLITG